MDIPLWQAVGIMEMLWQVTAREAPRGDIGKLSDEDIALALDYRGDESALIDHLVAAGWIDRDPSHRLVIHDWYDHADDAVHMRIARSRQFFVRGERPKLARLGGDERTNALKFYESVPAVRTNEAVEHGPRLGPAWAPPGPRLGPAWTPPGPGPGSDGTNGFMRVPEPPKPPPKDPLPGFERFWSQYPLKDGHDLALRVWIGLVTAADIEERVVGCLTRYLGSDLVARAVVKKPNNWLHDCARDDWKTDWPKAKPVGTAEAKPEKKWRDV